MKSLRSNTITPEDIARGAREESYAQRLQVPATQWGSSSGPIDTYGVGTPEGIVTAAIGSTYRRTDGGASTSPYVKESGTGNTGWVGK